MTRRRTLMRSIVTARSWMLLLAFVLNSIVAATKTNKHIRSKDRVSVAQV
jgi:hypothetical protein